MAEPSEAPVSQPDAPARPRRWLRGVILTVVLVLLAWVVIAGIVAYGAYGPARRGARELREVKAAVTTEEVDPLDPALRERLAEAESDLASAAADLDSVWVLPARILPVLGRQVRTAETLAAAGATVAATTSDLLATTADLRASADLGTGAGRVAALEQMGTAAGDAAAELGAIDLGSGNALLGPVEDQWLEFSAQLDELEARLSQIDDVTTGVAAFLRGPSRYLVFAANNAEMRAGSGMFLSMGVLEARDGELVLTDFRPSVEAPLPAAPLEVDADFQHNFGWTLFEQEWRNLASSPRFDMTGALAAQMWEKAGGGPVDGVLVLDPVALRAVIAATGAVQVAGEEIDAVGVVPFLLHGQYRRFGELAERRDFLAGVAAAALIRLQGGQFDLVELGRGLASAAGGRHVLAWSSDPAQQAAWDAAGISGRLADDTLILTLQNRATNKTDQFLEVSSVLEIDEQAGPDGTVGASLTTRITNNSPTESVPYVLGPPGGLTADGQYVGIVALNLPAFATVVPPPPDLFLAVDGRDGSSWMRGYKVDLQRGESATFTFPFRLPAGPGQMNVHSSARVPPVSWRYRDSIWDDTRSHTVYW